MEYKNSSERYDNSRFNKILVILLFAIVIALFANVMVNRYTIVAAGEKSAYKMNRITGKTYFLVVAEEFEVKSKKLKR